MTVRRKEVTNKITQILKGTSSGTSYVQEVMVIVHSRFILELAVLSLRASCRSLGKLLLFGALLW